jgi:nicotinamide-nucleotide amidase
MKRPEQILANLLKERGLTIAFAESMSCGLLAHKLGSIAGTSDVLMGSMVCYCEDVKCSALKVNKQLIKKHTAESQIVTDALAKNLKKLIKADIYAAITGLAAEGGSETKTKPVGTVFYSFLYKNKKYKLKKHFRGSPLQIKEKACAEFFKFMTKEIKENS